MDPHRLFVIFVDVLDQVSEKSVKWLLFASCLSLLGTSLTGLYTASCVSVQGFSSLRVLAVLFQIHKLSLLMAEMEIQKISVILDLLLLMPLVA